MLDRVRGALGMRRVRIGLAVGLASAACLSALPATTPAVRAAGSDWTGAVGVAASPGGGYWIAASYGDVVALGNAANLGGTGRLNQPIVGVTADPAGSGYWLVASDGGVFPFGGAGGYGSTGNIRLNQPIVGIEATASGRGYWLVAADGGIFPFGDAIWHSYGSTGSMRLNKPIVGMARTPTGNGYWLVAADGGIFPFGDALWHSYGSTGNVRLNRPIVGMAKTASGNGYWLVASDGGIFPFGDALWHSYGSTGGWHLNAPIVGMARNNAGDGYWLVAADGGIFPFGNAGGWGSAVGRIRYNTDDVVSRPECGAPASAVTPGKVIVISLACQELSAYQNGFPLYTTVITTGRPALPTPPGQYSVLYKLSPFRMVSDWPRSSPYWYPPSWTQYTLWFRWDGYAIHDAPWRAVYGPGTQANGSHGCVNVPMPIMASIYRWADVGTPVRVY